MRARRPLAACCAAVAALAGCGGHDKPRAAKPQRPVALTIDQPSDAAVVEAEMVDVRGTVEPAGADVRVLGRPATVSGTVFSVDVPLDPGANVVDVIATAPRRSPLLTALRVTRVIFVSVPRLAGSELDDAGSALRRVGLKLDAQRGPDSFIDALLPGKPKVCRQQPAPGTRVRKGTTVQAVLSKSC